MKYKQFLIPFGVFALTLGLVLSANAAVGAPMLFGGAVAEDGHVKLVSDLSDADPTNDFSGISFEITDTNLEDISTLGTDFNVTDDDCFGGSPRFQLQMDTNSDSVADGNVFVYLGPVPSFTGCTPDTWEDSGNLIGSSETRYDLTQFGGPFYGTYADAVALLGSDTVMKISLVVDSGWGFGDMEQTVLVDNVRVDGQTFHFDPPADKDECKNGGWMTFVDPVFKNQGDCVSFVASEGKAKGNPQQ